MSRASYYRHVDSDPDLRRRLDVLADPVRKRKHLDEAAVRAYAAEQLAALSRDLLVCERVHTLGIRECTACSGVIPARARACRHCSARVESRATS